MSRLINTDDLHKQVLLDKPEWGIFQDYIDHIIEDVVSQVPTTSGFTKKQVIQILEGLQKQAERLKEFCENQREQEESNEQLEAYWYGQTLSFGKMATMIKRRIEVLKAD